MTGVPTFVLNGWAAGPEAWSSCSFSRERLFDYLEQLDGESEKILSLCPAFVLVGFSLGGSTALRMLLRFPDRVRGLVLVSATPRMMEERVGTTLVWKGMTVHRRAALKYGTQLTHAGDTSPLFQSDNLDRGLDLLQTTDLRRELEGISASVRHIPVEILQSEHDGIVRPSNAQFLHEIFPQATLTLVPGCEHSLCSSRPELVDEAVERIRTKILGG